MSLRLTSPFSFDKLIKPILLSVSKDNHSLLLSVTKNGVKLFKKKKINKNSSPGIRKFCSGTLVL